MAKIRTTGGLLLLALLTAFPAAAQRPDPDARRRCWGNDREAPVLIEVYSDFQCPHCRTLYLETMRSVLADYASAGKACVAYYEFPLPNNKYSRAAARYALAASRLGAQKWVQVMDVLYYYQAQWSEDGEIDPIVARALSGKDMEQVRGWVKDPKLDALIDHDIAAGKKRGVGSTPTLFITAHDKTEKVIGAVQYGILRRYLENLLARR